MVLLVGVGIARADSPRWALEAWPYRARIECPAGEGDVAHVTVSAGGRTTDDGRDLRLVDADGSYRHFDILHHDPELETKIRFRPDPGKVTTTWLYYGNERAAQMDTANPGLADALAAHEMWSRRNAQRRTAVARRDRLQAALATARGELDRAVAAHDANDPNAPDPMTGHAAQRVADLEAQLRQIDVPDVGPEPVVPEAWQAARGVLLRTYRKPPDQAGDHPDDIQGIYRMIERGTLEGAGFRDGISDGYNPFGPSDGYVSSYAAYLRIDKPGRFGLATVSDDGSWVFLGDKLVVAWPGGHGHEEGARGEKNGFVHLDKGVHHIRYFHEEGGGGQMAYLAWQPPGAERFEPIPKTQWTGVRQAKVSHYEAKDQPILAVPEIHVRDTYWIDNSDDRQATRLVCVDRSAAPKGAQVTWRFGDGLSASGGGEKVEHVYFRLGRPEITLTVKDPSGRSDSVTVSPRLWQVDVVAQSTHSYGQTKDYVRAAAGYDLSKMARDDLKRYAEFWGFIERPSEHFAAARAFVERFGDDPAAGELAAGGAEAALDPEVDQPARAERLLELAARRTESIGQREALTLDRADVLAWRLDDPNQAQRLYQQTRDQVEQRESGGESRARRATVGLGDCALLNADYDRAEKLYRMAESMSDDPLDQPQELARSGSYGYVVEDLLARDEYEYAIRSLDRWERELPTQKLEGYSFFLRGKVLFVRKPSTLALKYLELAERVAPDAVHVPEAVWLRANCLMGLERYEEALVQLARIRNEFTYSNYYDRAPGRIAECRKKLTADGAEGGKG